jgi:hypothetical protein
VIREELARTGRLYGGDSAVMNADLSAGGDGRQAARSERPVSRPEKQVDRADRQAERRDDRTERKQEADRNLHKLRNDAVVNFVLTKILCLVVGSVSYLVIFSKVRTVCYRYLSFFSFW